MFVNLIVVVLVLWFVFFRYKRRRMYKLASMIPGSKDELPIIGVAHKLIGNTEHIMTALQKFSYGMMESDKIVRYWLGPKLYFGIMNPVDVALVLKITLEKDDLHRFIRNLFGNGFSFAPMIFWKPRRKNVMPAFSKRKVEDFIEVFSQQSIKLTKILERHVNTGTFKLWPLLNAYSFDAVCDTTLGVKLNVQEKPDFSFLKSLNQFLNLACERIFHLWLQPDWLYKLFPQYTEHEKCIKDIHQFIDQLLTHTGGEKGYTDEELREEMLAIAVAGIDTSAVSIGFTMKLLSKYPDVQEKVYQELKEVFGDSDRPIDRYDLPKLIYLERVIKESLRLYPSVPFIIRKILEDITISSGHTIPAGSGVIIPIWGLHRDPKYWGPEAEHFDPDRFLPERFNLEHTCSYIPFSTGPRNCPGHYYALLSVKTAVATVLRSYKLVGEPERTTIPHIRVKLDVMMKDADDCLIALERRR
ncbi:cytochrome P450 4V2-like [Aphomia sociella]